MTSSRNLITERNIGGCSTLHQDDERDGSGDHIQYQTLIRCTDKLVLALSGSPRSIADKLVSEELISEEVHKSLQPLSLTSEDIARKMLDSVKTTIRLTPRRYKDFVQILQKDAALCKTEIIDSLHEAYSSILRDQKALQRANLMMSKSPDQGSMSTTHTTDSETKLDPKPTVLQKDVEAAQVKKLSLVDAFKKLVIKMKSVLKKRGESVDEFRDLFLLSLNAFEKERHYHFFDRRKTAICDSTTYDELFLVLDFYWDYLNYHLLECLVREYGDKDVKSRMKEYLEDVSTFMENTTLQVFWEIEPCLKSVPPSGFTETVVKHDQDISVESTLKDVENIRIRLANEIQLSKYAILLSTIQEGCIQITWFTVFHCEMTSTPNIIMSSLPTAVSVPDPDETATRLPRRKHRYRIHAAVFPYERPDHKRYTVCRPDVDFGVYHRTPSAGTWAGVSDGIGAAADGVGRGARSGAWKGAKIGALIGTTFGSFFAAAEYWDLSTSGRDPFSGVHFCSNSVKKNTFDSKIVIASAIVGLFILITGIVFCTFIGTTLGAILCGIQDVYGMLCRHTFYDVHILPIGDLLGGEITSIISRRATPLCVSDLPQIMKQLRSESWSRSLDNRFKAESKACGQRSSYNGMEVSIRSWIQVNPFPTWEDLEAVFREVDEFSIASKIKDIIPDMN